MSVFRRFAAASVRRHADTPIPRFIFLKRLHRTLNFRFSIDQEISTGDDALCLAEAYCAHAECGEFLALLDHPIYEDARQVAEAARRLMTNDSFEAESYNWFSRQDEEQLFAIADYYDGVSRGQED